MRTWILIIGVTHAFTTPWLGGGAVTASGEASENDRVLLRESFASSACTQARIEVHAQGLYRPALAPEPVTSEATMPKPLALDVKTRLIFVERPLKSGSASSRPRASSVPGGSGHDELSVRGSRAARWVIQAAAAINGEIRPTASALRPELSLLLAERTAEDGGGVVVVSPSGQLTRAELELVQGLGDPLLLVDFLPAEPTAKGGAWSLPKPAVISLSGYDLIKTSTMKASLELLDDQEARIQLKGKVEGSVLGGEGTVSAEGFLHFDRRAGLIDRLEIQRVESRRPGPVEAGLDVKSTLTIVRRPARVVAQLSDNALSRMAMDSLPRRRLLQLVSPDGKYNLLHDRQWHVYWDDPKLVVLKRLDKGTVVAQCNLAAGPNAGKGKHEDLSKFRDDLKRSLQSRFVQFLGAGEVDGDPAGGFRYKVGVQGRQGDLDVLWDYYLVASPDGDQLLATFTMAEKDAASFGSQDTEMIGSLQWTSPADRVKKTAGAIERR
jgi:hypothetical protein